jgi:hypothetical protein
MRRGGAGSKKLPVAMVQVRAWAKEDKLTKQFRSRHVLVIDHAQNGRKQINTIGRMPSGMVALLATSDYWGNKLGDSLSP